MRQPAPRHWVDTILGAIVTIVVVTMVVRGMLDMLKPYVPWVLIGLVLYVVVRMAIRKWSEW